MSNIGKTYVNKSNSQQKTIQNVDSRYVTFTSGEKVTKQDFFKMYRESGANESASGGGRDFSMMTGNGQPGGVGADADVVDPLTFFSSSGSSTASLANQLIQGQQKAATDPNYSRMQEQQYRNMDRVRVHKDPNVRVKGAKVESLGGAGNQDAQQQQLQMMSKSKLLNEAMNNAGPKQNQHLPDPSLQRSSGRRRPQMEDDVVFDDDPVDYTESKPARQTARKKSENLLDNFDKDHQYKMSIPVKVKSFAPEVIKMLQSNTKGKTKTEVMEMVVKNIVQDIMADEETIFKQVKKHINSEVNPRKKKSGNG